MWNPAILLSRVLKKVKKRLLARAAQKAASLLPTTD